MRFEGTLVAGIASTARVISPLARSTPRRVRKAAAAARRRAELPESSAAAALTAEGSTSKLYSSRRGVII